MTGKELKQTIDTIENGIHGYYPTWNLIETFKKGEPKKLNKLTFLNGTEILEEKSYRGVTVDFLLSGGDDFENVIGNTSFTLSECLDIRFFILSCVK